MANTQTLHSGQIIEIEQLINKVSRKQLEDFGRINSEIKPDGSLITECDRWSDESIVNGIHQIAPNEGVLSEEGSKNVPESNAYWIVDPLDGTTNFAAGIPFWSISIARFVNGEPESAFLDIPALNTRFIAVRNKGVLINNKAFKGVTNSNNKSECISLCSRTINMLQTKTNKAFPGKIRILGVSSLNMISVATGQTFGAVEATPKIWDIAASWLILSELRCIIKWLKNDPKHIKQGQDLSQVNFPLIAVNSEKNLEKIAPLGNIINAN